ncbi:MAG TPA: SMP-30/gluconolactonase/LRE family protein [Abditibacteriaceae bacterium]
MDGQLSKFLEPAGRANGLCFDAQNRLWACADEKNELWRIDLATGKTEILIKDYASKLLNGPNDIWVRPDGGAYFTDPLYKRPYWNRGPQEQDNRAVYFLSPDGQKLTRVTDDLKQPNGIIGTPDGKTLYVADIDAKQTFAYDIQADGALSNKRLFCAQGSDGMTLDEQGNVYLTGRGVSVYDKTGQKTAQIDVPEGWTANVCFGGVDKKTLFISSAVSASVSLNYVVSNGSARSGSDFGASPGDSDGGTPGTLTLAANQTTGTITVPIIGDMLDEPNELFYVLISSPIRAFISRGRAIGTINDNDLPPSITVDNSVVVEGNSGERFATFALRLSSPSGQAVRVTVQTTNPAQGTPAATAGSDYTALAPTVVTFNIGASAAIARVLVQSDMLDEPNETFVLNLSTPVNATIADNQGVASISDDDATPSLAINDVSVTEGNSGTKTLTFTVTKTGLSANGIMVNFTTANGTARSDSDFVSKGGALYFVSGETSKSISVTINGDTLVEAGETFYVILSSATNAAIGRGRGTATISNDDASG